MRSFNLFLTLISLIFSGYSIAASELTFETQALQRPSPADSKITYHLGSRTKPANNLLLILQGSDCRSALTNNSVNEVLPKVRPDADVLLIEKWGLRPETSECPQTYIDNDSPSQRVSDAKQVLEHLNKGYQSIYVLGGSEGAVIAVMLREAFPGITATIAFNGGGNSFQDDIEHNIKASTPAEVTASVLAEFREFAEQIKTSNEPFTVNSSQHGYKWWKEMLTLKQINIIERGKTPLLIVQSGQDASVDPERTHIMIENLSSSENVKYQYFEELDHGLRKENGDSIDDSVLAVMRGWFKKH
ncbi:acyl-CoA thioester hydrolase/BAAT C-terminal domain-containing protein [Idiomarina sp. Sol25]|uniref:acyl-CoA thioester hydrolase/BAAT C-terminal domain-containing protein n=1 Tax=Idiomarina sp. Sol25 TaxID=3064000 RepID=UPI00294AA82E|nr:acyl-CoA thioester hydrolase/BAAT C-terminal domain-containing protein [Idiomarina sp. Sol25]MDV6327214.1 acyl-CoA thioester hydrolase/BAAT C-terminal domain-containing protein [Idiomarina sp. Sol25]